MQLPITPGLNNRTNSYTKDSRMVNCYKETRNGKSTLVKRPAKSNFTLSTPLTPNGQGLWSYNNNLYAASNGVLYQITGGTTVTKATGLNTTNTFSFVNTSTTTSPHPYMVFHDKVSGYYLDATGTFVDIRKQIGQVSLVSGGTGYPASGTFTVSGTTGSGAAGTYTSSGGVISNVVLTNHGSNYSGTLTVAFSGTPTLAASATAILNAFPANPVSGLVYLDGYVFAMDSQGTIWQSNQEDPSTWISINYIRVTGEPDQGKGIVKHLNYLVAFKEWTTEFLYDAANPAGNVLGNNISARLEVGCASGDSIQQLEEAVIWVASPKEGGRNVSIMQGQTAQTISNKAVENYLNASNLTGLYSWIYKVAGHTFYGLVLTDQDVTLVYDLHEKEWHHWTTSKAFIGGGEGYFECTFIQNFPDNATTTYVLDAVTGNVYLISPTTYVDPFGPVTVRVVTDRLALGSSKRKVNSELVVYGDYSNDTLQVRFSDDDYTTWSSYRNVDLSLSKPVLYNLGSFRRRVYELLYTGTNPLRIEEVELTLSGDFGQGAS